MMRSLSSPPSTVYRLPSLAVALILGAFVMLSAQTLTPIAPPPSSDSSGVDTLAVKKPPLRADTAVVVMHHFNHRQQLITGGAIMATMISIMVVMNNYNPRVPQ
jgi:hypothetical protein